MPRLVLPSFDPPEPETASGREAAAALAEEARLAAFENGYRAGWDDAAAAEAAEQKRIRADLARNLQGLSFTYYEARAEVVRALAPLFEDMVGKVLPRAARVSLPALVAERLMPPARAAAELRAEISANPDDLPAIESALDVQSDLTLSLHADPTLGEGQVTLRLVAPDETTEQRIDVTATVDAISDAVTAFFAGTATAPARPPAASDPAPQPEAAEPEERQAHG